MGDGPIEHTRGSGRCRPEDGLRVSALSPATGRCRRRRGPCRAFTPGERSSAHGAKSPRGTSSEDRACNNLDLMVKNSLALLLLLSSCARERTWFGAEPKTAPGYQRP